LGFVNAALEFRAQIDQGIMPMPDAIYLPVGSCGTVAGLLLGMQIAGITSRVEGIVVVENERLAVIQELFTQTNELLHSFDPTIPLYKFPEQQLHLNTDFCGTVYGQPTAEGMHALTLLKEYEEITLEGTYSAKAFAALINDCQNGAIKPDQVVLFWNTYCGLDFSHLTDTVDYHELPLPAYQYFNTHQM
jgi:D-cysteine desulfhydrase